MNTLLFHETKKLFSKKTLLFAVVFLLFVNAFNIYRSNDRFRDPYNRDTTEAEWQFYETLEGKITAEKLKKLTDYMIELNNAAESGDVLPSYYINAEGDRMMVSRQYDKIEKIYRYEEKIDELLKENERQTAIYRQKGNTYLVKTSELVADVYSERSIDSYYDVETYATYFNYDFSSFLLLMLIFLATSSLYAGESESGMLPLIRSTAGGRLRLAYAKLASAAVFIISVCLAFFLCDFLMFLWCARLRGITNPIYSIDAFAYSPLTVSVGAFVLLLAAVKLLGFLCFGLLACLFSSVFKKSYMAFTADFVMTVGLMTSAYSGGFIEYVNLINPIRLLTGRSLYSSFAVTDIFGTPVFRSTVTLTVSAVFMTILVAFIGLINNPNNVRKSHNFDNSKISDNSDNSVNSDNSNHSDNLINSDNSYNSDITERITKSNRLTVGGTEANPI